MDTKPDLHVGVRVLFGNSWKQRNLSGLVVLCYQYHGVVAMIEQDKLWIKIQQGLIGACYDIVPMTETSRLRIKA